MVDSNALRPEGLAVDWQNSKIYWTSSVTNDTAIRRANFDGSEVEVLIFQFDVLEPGHLELDVAGGKMYWVDNLNTVIRRANLDGSQIETIYSPSSISRIIDYLALDLAERKIYWTDQANKKIQRANLDGTNVEDVITGNVITGFQSFGDLAVDQQDRKLYFVSNHEMKRVNLDGTGLETVAAGSTLSAFRLDTANRKLYWVDSLNHALTYVDIDDGTTGSVATLPEGSPDLFSLRVENILSIQES